MNRNAIVLDKVYLSTSAEKETFYDRWHERRAVAASPFQAGGRCGTVELSIEEFTQAYGPPQVTGICDTYGKPEATWLFETPRGPVQVGTYWWNGPRELSIRAADVRGRKWLLWWLLEMKPAVKTNKNATKLTRKEANRVGLV